MPDPGLFGHGDAYRLYTTFAAGLVDAGLADRFPRDPEVRKIMIELLAEREAIENLVENPDLIAEVIDEARGVLDDLRRRGLR